MTAPNLPFALTPIPGESFDSWFEAYAARLDVCTGDLAQALGLPAQHLRTTIGMLLANGVEGSHLRRVAAATGVPAAALRDLFHRAGPTPSSGKPVVTRAIRMAWTPTAATRFCPRCLAENGGRFTLAWRLPWTFFCLHHNEVLATACPACHQPPRARTIAVAHRPEPTRCCSPNPHRTRGTSINCGGDLTSAVEATVVTANDARRAQLFINDKLDQAGTHRDGAPTREAVEALTDLTVLAHNLANPGRIGTRRVRAHMLNAGTLATAVRLLTGHQYAHELAAVVRRQAHPDRRTPAVPESWRPASTNLTARIAHGRDADLSATERLRYATPLPAPSPAPRAAVDPAITRASHIPDQIWSGWTIRLTNDDRHDPVRLRPAAAVALLLPHSDLKLPAAGALLSEHIQGDSVEHQLTALASIPNGDATLRILTELSLALDQHGSPINYARRRRLAATNQLIDAALWRQLSRRHNFFKGSRRRLHFAQCYLYELLTDGSLTIAPPRYNLPSHLRAEYHEFVLALPAPLVDDLHHHARTLLHHNGIADEPLQWQPPKEWVTVDAWPGADPDLTDAAPLQRELHDSHPASTIARRHGLSMEHLRHIIRHHPLPGADQPRHRPGAILPATDPAHRRQADGTYHVNVAWLHEQYVTWRRSLADIAAEIGCHRTTLGDFAKQHGICLRPRGGGADFIAPNLAPAHPAALPSPLRDALTGQDARSRIDRFLLIANHGTVRKAAAQLGRSDTTLHKQLASLESRCGGPLFDRPPRRLGNLTQLGRQLRHQAAQHLKPPDPTVMRS
jgi:hypothetical protein